MARNGFSFWFLISGVGLMVEHALAKGEIGVRFSYAAQNIIYSNSNKGSGWPLSVLYTHKNALKNKNYVDNYVCIVYKRQIFKL